jgi:hypothetical protein
MKRGLAVACGAAVLALVSTAARAEVYQCLDAGGKMLLTDSPCPPGYTANLVVGHPPSPEEDGLAYRDEAEQRAADEEARRRAAEAEVARLRAELATERRKDDVQQDRIDQLDRKLDALLQQPEVYGGTVYGGTAVAPVPGWPVCGPGGRPWVDCRPNRPGVEPKPHVLRPEARNSSNGKSAQDCGIAGCTPGITRFPSDDRRGAPERR